MKTTQRKPALDPNDLIDTVQAAPLIGLKPATLRMWRHEQKQGQPDFIQLPGGAIRYSKTHLAEWLDTHTQSGK